MRKFVTAIAILMVLIITSCETSSSPLGKEDKLPPDFSGIRSVTAIDNDLVFDYFMVRWYKAKDDVTPSEKITYKIYYKRNETDLAPLLAGVVTGETLSYIVKIQRQVSNRELLPYYYFQVAAIDEVGNIKESKLVKARAQDFNPPSWGYVTEVKEIDYTHLLIKWFEAEDDRTYPSHIKYNIFATTNKAEIDYSDPISVVTGITQCIVNFDLRNYQNKTIYFTVVAEDLSENRNINGIFRSLTVGKVEMKPLGTIRRPVGKEFTLDLSSIAPGMGFKIISAPESAEINGNTLTYTPSTTDSVYFHIEGNNAQGDIAVITFTLMPFEPPVKYELTSPIKFMVPSTDETIYSLSVSNTLDKYVLQERFDSFVFNPESITDVAPSTVTWAAAPGYFSYITMNSERFYLTVVNLKYETEITQEYEISNFKPCASTGYMLDFTPEKMAMNGSFIVVEGAGLIQGFSITGEKLFGFYLENQNIRNDLTFCTNYDSEVIDSYGPGTTIEAVPYNGSGKNLAIHLIKPTDRILLLTSFENNIFYSLNSTASVVIKQLVVSPEGQVYLLGTSGELLYLYGNNWIKILTEVDTLLYGGSTPMAVKANGVYNLNGFEPPINILPTECESFLNDSVRGIVNQAERLWLILENKAYSCSK